MNYSYFPGCTLKTKGAQLDRADPDFMAEREDVVSDEGRFEP